MRSKRVRQAEKLKQRQDSWDRDKDRTKKHLTKRPGSIKK